YTTTDSAWINHAWLYDLILYGLYKLDSTGILLVIIKALALTALAELMLRMRRGGQSLGPPAFCTALALLVLSPRLLLQPHVVSLLFLGLTLWLLHTASTRGWLRMRPPEPSGKGHARKHARLPTRWEEWRTQPRSFYLVPLAFLG